MDKAALTAERPIETEPVEIPGHGTAIVRKLSRGEYLRAGKHEDPVQFERVVLAAALVDPDMDEHDVAAWQTRPGSSEEIQPVIDKIMVWSGFRKDATKSGV